MTGTIVLVMLCYCAENEDILPSKALGTGSVHLHFCTAPIPDNVLSQASLPPHLAKRAQQLREKGFKSPEILAKQMEIAHKKRQAKLEERKAKAAEGGIRAAKVRTAKEAFGENFELMSGHSRCQPPVKMPKHLAKRLATLTKARRSKEEIDAKHAEATARRAVSLVRRYQLGEIQTDVSLVTSPF